MTIQSEKDLVGLRGAGRVVAFALKEMREALEPGMTTGELDAVVTRVFERHGALSAPGSAGSGTRVATRGSSSGS